MKRVSSSNGNIQQLVLLGVVLVAIVGVFLLVKNSQTNTMDNPGTSDAGGQSIDKSADKVPEGVAGYIGGSLTNNAVEGYGLLGGMRFWEAKRGNYAGYGGGTIEKWADGLNAGSVNAKYWKAFDQLHTDSKTRGKTTVIWVQLLGRGAFSDNEYYEASIAVINEVRKRIPDAEIYISAMNDYDPKGTCKTITPDAPEQMQRIVDRLVADGKAKRGPNIGSITAAQVDDGDCHANDEGKKVEGKPLLDFFGQ